MTQNLDKKETLASVSLNTQAVDSAALEFEREYLPELEQRIAEVKSREEAARQVSEVFLRGAGCLGVDPSG